MKKIHKSKVLLAGINRTATVVVVVVVVVVTTSSKKAKTTSSIQIELG